MTKNLRFLAALSLVACALQIAPAPVLASSEAFTGNASVSGVYGVPISLSTLQVSGVGNDTINVRLYVSGGSLAMSTTTGLTFSGSSTGSPLQFSGTRTNINNALATLTYTKTTAGTDTLEASLTNAGEVYDATSGHLYEVVTSTQTWTAAQSAAAGRTKYGATGYLATITSSQENAFVAARLSSDGWMGASDTALEGDWKWVAGPETGTSFWSGNGSGSAVSGRYANWNTSEPNDSGSNEDCAQFLVGTGKWNDLPCTGTTLPAYVVEYGTTGALPAVTSKNIAITVNTSSHNISSCAQLQNIANTANTHYDTFVLSQDIDCSGISNFTPIGSGGGAAWSVFRGTFDGNGHTISNLTIDDTGGQAGLFAESDRASFHDVTLASGSIESNGANNGALVGEATETSINNVTSAITVSGGNFTGGLVGFYTMTGADITLTNLHVNSTISATTGSEQTGGIIGGALLYDGAELIIARSGFTGTITGDQSVGGILGQVYMEENGTTGITLRDSFAQSEVTGDLYVGGLVGSADPNINNSNAAGTCYITLTRVYASGSTNTTTSYGGGLVGYESGVAPGETFTVTDSFSASIPSGSGSNRAALFSVNNVPSGGTITTQDVVVDDTRTGFATWANVATTGVTNVNTPGSPNSTYFFRTTTQEPLDEWDFSSGNLWYVHPNDFPTHAPGYDDDEDGIATTVENAGPNNGDANNDGTADGTQSHVASFTNSITGNIVAVEVPSACKLTSVSTRTEAQVGVDSGYNYSQGLVRFAATCNTSGYTANVKLYFYNTTSSGVVVRKANPTRQTFYAMPNAMLTQLTIGGQNVTRAAYEVTDGSELDEDGSINGTIIDPAGLAHVAVGAPNTGFGGARR